MYFTWDPQRATDEAKSMLQEAEEWEWGVNLSVWARSRPRQERRESGKWSEGMEEGGGAGDREETEDEEGSVEYLSRLSDELDKAVMKCNAKIMENSLMKMFPPLQWALPGEFSSSIRSLNGAGARADMALCVRTI